MFTQSARLLAMLCLFGVARLPAATLYVDINSTNPVAPYTSWATAATNIQDAVDAASFVDAVLFSNVIYHMADVRCPARP
jgi:hypothetical protein